MIYVDDYLKRAKIGRLNDCWSHLFADEEYELKIFGDILHLKREWIQTSGFLHYDVTSKKRAEAIMKGAIPLKWPGEVKKWIKNKRSLLKQ